MEVRGESANRGCLINLHEPAVAFHVSVQNSSELSCEALFGHEIITYTQAVGSP